MRISEGFFFVWSMLNFIAGTWYGYKVLGLR